jgi:glycosyltransferase involved in cell wall biosynthesis
MRLGILTSHPIQYQAPWFRALAKEVDLEVFFAHRPDASQQGVGFGRAFSWDVDLLSGYQHRFLENVARQPSSNRFFGCDTPEIKDIIQESRTSDHGRRTTKRFDALIVSGWNLKSYWQAVRACRHVKIPVLVRGDSQLLTPRSRLIRVAKAIAYPLLLRQFDGFLAVGQRNRDYLEHYGARPAKIFFVRHFVDNHWFKAKADVGRRQKAEIRKRWGMSDTSFIALFVGKFQAIKRPGDLLKALGVFRQADNGENKRDASPQPILADNNINVRHPAVVFVGAGEMESELRELAQRENVHIHFAGFKNQSELPACYAAADVLVLPSESETWGLVVNEAMACGLPAIVSNAVGCAPDLIDEGTTGFTYPVGDTAALAQSLAALAKMQSAGHDFGPALAEKTRAYGLQNAVAGTLLAVRQSAARGPQSSDGAA